MPRRKRHQDDGHDQSGQEYFRDPAGNNIRIIDLIRGKTLFNHIAELQLSHEAYTVQALPDILARLVGCTEAMASLHDRGLTHGDIRNDHILVESDTGRYRWIDFDYTINYSDFDIWSMGNVLTYAVSKGIITCRSAIRAGVELSEDDALLFYGYRVANVRKVHPHVPRELNDLLMRFSHGSTDFVSSFDELAEGLRVAAAALRPAS